jgi:hypothetical protein
MKRNVKGFVLGFIAACLMITPMIAFADTIQVTLNAVNIKLNGEQAAVKGQSYSLNDGTIVPYSLNYNGTVYLPIRKVSELVGKDIAYDGQSSTISISDKKTDNEEQDAVSEDTKDLKTGEKEDALDNTSNTDNAQAESGLAVVNEFWKELNTSGIQVNRVVGYLDGKQCNMLTSKKDLIDFSGTAPSLYKIKYSNKVITEMTLISPDVTDTVKVNAQTNSIEGVKASYNISSNAVCYEIKMSTDGTFGGYAVYSGYVKAGCKIYLYETNGAKGYDIILMDRSSL